MTNARKQKKNRCLIQTKQLSGKRHEECDEMGRDESTKAPKAEAETKPFGIMEEETQKVSA